MVDFHLVLGCLIKACDSDCRFCRFPARASSSSCLLSLVSQVCPQLFFLTRRLAITVSAFDSLARRSPVLYLLMRLLTCTWAWRGITISPSSALLWLSENCPQRHIFSTVSLVFCSQIWNSVTFSKCLFSFCSACWYCRLRGSVTEDKSFWRKNGWYFNLEKKTAPGFLFLFSRVPYTCKKTLPGRSCCPPCWLLSAEDFRHQKFQTKINLFP